MVDQDEKEVREYPEILATIADHLTEFLIKKGFSDQEALKVAFEGAETVRNIFGGEGVYIPKAVSYMNSKRDLEILEMFNGSNFHEVCKKYQITRRRIHQILCGLKQGRQNFLDFGDDHG